MSSEHSSDVKFEIGHVLFIDIVGCSKMFITDQSEQLQTLKQIVHGTEQFRLAEAEGKLLRLPTGDGGEDCAALLRAGHAAAQSSASGGIRPAGLLHPSGGPTELRVSV